MFTAGLTWVFIDMACDRQFDRMRVALAITHAIACSQLFKIYALEISWFFNPCPTVRRSFFKQEIKMNENEEDTSATNILFKTNEL